MLHYLSEEFKGLKPDIHKTLHKEKSSQVDIMYVSDNIPMESHTNMDQYTLVLSGEGYIEIPREKDQVIYKDVLIVIPRNTKHKIINTGGSLRPLKIMTFYSF